MRDSREVQNELDEAQRDLESKVGQLKELFAEKLETPKHVVEAIRKPLHWIGEHRVVVALAVGGMIGFAIYQRRFGRRRRGPLLGRGGAWGRG